MARYFKWRHSDGSYSLHKFDGGFFVFINGWMRSALNPTIESFLAYYYTTEITEKEAGVFIVRKRME